MISQRLFTFCFQSRAICHGIRVIRSRPLFFQQKRNSSDEYTPQKHYELMIGNREQVGTGVNGLPNYVDTAAFPFPAIRYKQNSPEIMALREKEKGNWTLLSIEDKKALYRASYCQTFVEFQFVTSEWMAVIGWLLIHLSAAMWLYIAMNYFVNNPYPESYSVESKEAQLRRQIRLKINPVFGLASKWDYEKMQWKDTGFFAPDNPFDECDEDE